jgi:hypothetical protein
LVTSGPPAGGVTRLTADARRIAAAVFTVDVL